MAGKISITSDIQMTPPLCQKVKKRSKSEESEEEESKNKKNKKKKTGLKLIIQKTKIMTS